MEDVVKTKEHEKQKEFEISRDTLDRVVNFLIEESDRLVKESEYQKHIIEEQRNAVQTMLIEYDDLATKYEDLFSTMMIEDTAALRKEILELKESLGLAESLMDFSDNKNKKK